MRTILSLRPCVIQQQVNTIWNSRPRVGQLIPPPNQASIKKTSVRHKHERDQHRFVLRDSSLSHINIANLNLHPFYSHTLHMEPSHKNVTRTNGVVAIGPASATSTIDSITTSKLPHVVQLLLVTIISFSTSFVLYSTGAPFLRNELSTVSRVPENVSDLLLFPLLRVAELSLGWFIGFDGVFKRACIYMMY